MYHEELFDNVVPFWLSNSVDKVYGGIYTSLDREGKLYSTDKSVWMQGRGAYMFSYLYNYYGANQEWLAYAKNCLDFIEGHCIDKTDGRMYFTVTKEGYPLRKRRYYFSETFYVIACAEYYKATKEEKYLRIAKKYYDFVYAMYLDPSVDPYKITEKTISATRKTKALANPMILLNVNSIMRSADPDNAARYDAIAKRLVADIKCFRRQGTDLLLEAVGINNEYMQEQCTMRIVNPGHSIEASWFLLMEGVHQGDQNTIDFARRTFDAAFEFGWDKEYEGLVYFKDIEGKPVEAYEHDMKLWWPHNEAAIASIMFFKTTGDKKYFDIFEQVTEYAFSHFSDPQYGEWFGYLRRDGKPTEPPCKGHTYKGPFHVLRMLATVEKCLSSDKL